MNKPWSHDAATRVSEPQPKPPKEALKITFVPNDIIERQLLGATPEPNVEINKEVITDAEVAKCYCSARTILVEHGTYEEDNACLLGFEFTFHPYLTRYKHAKIDLQFESTAAEPNKQKIRIVLVYPRLIKGEVSEEKVKRAISGQVTIGYEDHASATINATKEAESTLVHHMSIMGSVVGTDTVRWTLEENADQKNGIPLSLVGFVVIVSPGPFEAEVDMDATIGRIQAVRGTPGVFIDYVRQLLSGQPGSNANRVAFDSQTPVDRRENLSRSSFKVAGWTQKT